MNDDRAMDVIMVDTLMELSKKYKDEVDRNLEEAKVNHLDKDKCLENIMAAKKALDKYTYVAEVIARKMSELEEAGLIA